MLKRIIVIIIFFIISANISYSKDIYTIDRAVKEATSNNYTIKEAVENQKAALNQYRSSISDMLPKANFSYTYTRFKNNPYNYEMGEKMIDPHKNNIKWNVTITQPIFTGFALITKKEMAKLGLDIEALQKQKAVLDVAKNVKIAYYNILLAKKYLKVAEEEVKSLKAHVKDAKNLYDTGTIAYNDLLKSQVALASAVQNKTKMENNLKLAISSFNIALRKNINADTDVVDILNFKPFSYNFRNLLNEALQKRPVLKELNLRLKQSYLGIKLAKSEYYPHVAAFARYQQEGYDIWANKNNTSMQHSSMVGLKINWTIFAFGKRSFDTQTQQHKTLSLKEKIKSIKDGVKLEVKQAYLDLQTATNNIKTAKSALKQAKENFRITNLQYKQKMVTSTEVLDAQSYLTQAETNYYNALYGYYIALAKLQRAIGCK